jgi:hypothetical protein
LVILDGLEDEVVVGGLLRAVLARLRHHTVLQQLGQILNCPFTFLMHSKGRLVRESKSFVDREARKYRGSIKATYFAVGFMLGNRGLLAQVGLAEKQRGGCLFGAHRRDDLGEGGELGEQVSIGKKRELEVALEVVEDDFVEQARAVLGRRETLQRAAHGDVIGLDLGDDVLAETARAEADPVAEVADPTPVVLADVEVIVVAELEARVAELAAAAVLWFLAQLQVPLQVGVGRLFHVNIEELGHESLEALVLQGC